MEDCIFCKIIAGEIPAEKIYEDETIFAFMDNSPVSRGHVLVMPKKHSADFMSTDDQTLTDLIKKVRKIGTAIASAVGAPGMNFTTNNGKAAGQVIFHLHFHLIPRFSNDNLPPWPHHETTPAIRAEIAEEIKKQLK